MEPIYNDMEKKTKTMNGALDKLRIAMNDVSNTGAISSESINFTEVGRTLIVNYFKLPGTKKKFEAEQLVEILPGTGRSSNQIRFNKLTFYTAMGSKQSLTTEHLMASAFEEVAMPTLKRGRRLEEAEEKGRMKNKLRKMGRQSNKADGGGGGAVVVEEGFEMITFKIPTTLEGRKSVLRSVGVDSSVGADPSTVGAIAMLAQYDQHVKSQTTRCRGNAINAKVKAVVSRTPAEKEKAVSEVVTKLVAALPSVDLVSPRAFADIMKNQITAVEVCKTIDMNQSLNITGVEALRKMIKTSTGLSFVPNKSELSDCFKLINQAAHSLVGSDNPADIGVDSARLDFGKCVSELIRRTVVGRTDPKTGERLLEVHFQVTMDGAVLVQGQLTLLMAGFKVVTKTHSQSAYNCLPCIVAIMPEQKKLVDKFIGPLFRWCEEMERTGLVVDGVTYRLQFKYPMDQKGVWACSQSGCPSSVLHSHPCSYCECRHENLGEKTTSTGCLWCENIKKESKFCYHAALMGTAAETLTRQQMLTETTRNWLNPVAMPKSSDLKPKWVEYANYLGLDSTLTVDKLTHSIQVWYKTNGVTREEGEFCYDRCSMQRVKTNINLRFTTEQLDAALAEQMPYGVEAKSVSDQHTQLRLLLGKVLAVEAYILKMRSVGADPMVGDPTKFIPDVLHLDLRIGGKLLTLLFQECYRRYRVKEQATTIANLVLDLINKQCLRDNSEVGANFNVVPPNAGKKVSTISLGTRRMAKIFAKVDDIVTIIFSAGEMKDADVARKQDLRSVMTKWKIILATVNKPVITKAEVFELQLLMDSFGELYVTLFGSEQISNYVHFVISGHICEFMLLNGSLLRFSNIGWEALNAVIKKHYHNHTQRGGYTHSSKDGRVNCLPVAQALLRYIQRLWLYWLNNANGDVAPDWLAKLLIPLQQQLQLQRSTVKKENRRLATSAAGKKNKAVEVKDSKSWLYNHNELLWLSGELFEQEE